MGGIDSVASSIYASMERFGTGAKIGNIGLPDFNKMWTKTEPSRSDEELKEAIAKLARKDAEKGRFHEYTKEYLDLMKEYVSPVSPDREGIITHSIKQMPKNKEHQTLLELLMDKKDKTSTTDDTDYNIDFYDSKGELVAKYTSKYGWEDITTKAEGEQMPKFAAIYNEAWNSANAQNNKTMPKHLEGGAVVDAYA
jgi:hypothetical protein